MAGDKITVSADAKALIESRRAEAPEDRWHLTISWRKGEADNSRAADGASVWVRKPDKGWGARLTNWPAWPEGFAWPEGLPASGEPLLPGVRLLVSASGDRVFPGGELIVEDGKLTLIVCGA
jgi:hypothetical protein